MSDYPYTYGKTLIQVKDVSFSYGRTPVLKNISFEVKDVLRPGMTQGQIVGLLAPSGAGKTTLFNILAGLNKPDTGEVLVGDKAIPVVAGMVGVVPQNYPLFKSRTVLDNLLVAGEQAGMKLSSAKPKAVNLLERFGIADRAEAWPSQLSGGQRQRACICQQLMCSEHFLLMDEPFSGLDPNAKDAACSLIREVASVDEENTIFIVSHDIPSVIAVADTLLLMGRDRAADGTIIPGTTIKKTIDLIDRNLAWHPDIEKMPVFAYTVREVREDFRTL
jgi:polar amino acid transport system ATP-binding protein/sulfate transport system ATP-binding protein